MHAGSRVRVRFSGRLVDAYVLERRADSDHDGSLAFVERVVGPTRCSPPDTARLFRAVADRWAGSFVDVARLGDPGPARRRGARARRRRRPDRRRDPPAPPADIRSRYRAGAAFLTAVCGGRAARAVWSALPGEDWPARFAEVAADALAAGRGRSLVVPDARDLARLDRAMTAALGGPGGTSSLAADLGPAERYARWLAVRRGAVRVGDRHPVRGVCAGGRPGTARDLGRRRRSARRAARPVPARPRRAGAALVAGGHRAADRRLCPHAPRGSSWSTPAGRTRSSAERSAVRAAMPRVAATGDDAELARDPAAPRPRACRAWRGGRPGTRWPPAGRCWCRCPAAAMSRRWPARATALRRAAGCSGPLRRAALGRRCRPAAGAAGRRGTGPARHAAGGACVRSPSAPRRTAEELGRAFPGVAGAHLGRRPGARRRRRPARRSSSPRRVPNRWPQAATALRCCWTRGRCCRAADLRAAEETRRRWMNAAALVRPGGQVVVVADAGDPVGAGAGAVGSGRRGGAGAGRTRRGRVPARGCGWRR